MVVLAYSLVQHCFEVAATATGTIGEGIAKEGTVNEVIVDKEVGYEQTNFLDGISSIQETKKLASLIVVVSMVTKSYYSA